MPEDKIRVSARIPKDLYDTCLQRYDNITNAINTGLELLCNQSEDTYQKPEDKRQQSEDKRQTSEDNSSKGDIRELRARLEEKDKQMDDAQRQVKTMEESLRKAPDLVEFSQLQVRSEELEKHNQTLIKELEKASQDKEDLKNTYNNYFVQVQSLINQKAIEAPGNKKQWWKIW